MKDFKSFLPRILAVSSSCVTAASDWSGWGGDIQNNNWAVKNNIINSKTTTLVQQCRLEYAKGVSATPVTYSEENTVYFPTWGGLFISLDYMTCKEIWRLNVTTIINDFAPISAAKLVLEPFAGSRTSPQIDGDVIYFGTQKWALLLAVDRKSGKFLNSIQVNPHPWAIVTGSPTFYGGNIFAGAASLEEAAAGLIPNYTCCSFVGNMVSVKFDKSAQKFSINWNISMIPQGKSGIGQWSGSAVWGGQPAIDTKRNRVNIATGNTYAVPQAYEQCQNTTLNANSTTDSCLPKDIWQDSVLSIDIISGNPTWVRQVGELDAWSLACIPGFGPNTVTNCPQVAGPDADFGMAPTFVPGSKNTPQGKDTLVIGQKNGNLYAFDAETGSSFWTTFTSPDGASGGLTWGLAVDDSQVYFTAINANNILFSMQPSSIETNGSAYGAASLLTGALIWEVPTSPLGSTAGNAYGPGTVVGDIMISNLPSITTSPPLPIVQGGGIVLLQKSTGAVLGGATVDGPVRGGVSVQDEFLFFGTGYSGYQGIAGFYVYKFQAN